PNAVHAIAFWENGERQYYQIPDPLLFELFASREQLGKYVGFIAELGKNVVEPFRRAITQNLVFGFHNIASRDALQAMLQGEGLESLIPYFYVGTAIVNRLKLATGRGGVKWVVEEGELLARALHANSNDAHKTAFGRFLEMLGEGIADRHWSKMSPSQKVAAGFGTAMSLILKPIDVMNYVSLGRAFSALTEKLPREGAALRALARGEGEERAKVAYNEITGRFAQKPGSPTFNAYVGTTGFLNPNIQILWGYATKILDPDPRVRAFHVGVKLPALAALGAATAALGYLLIRAMFDDPEEILERMRERQDDDRLRYMAILGKVRVPFGFGPAGAMFSYGYNSVEGWLLDDPINGQKKALAVLSMAVDTPEITTALPPLPKTMAEISLGAKGYSLFYDREIVPGFLTEKFPYNPELQTLPDTPEVYNEIAEALTKTGVRVSPLKIAYFVENGFAKQYDNLAEAFGKWSQGKSVEPPDYPLVGRAIVREPRGRLSQSFRSLVDLDEQYQSLRATIEARLRENPNDKELAELAKRARALEPAHDALLKVERIWDEIRALKQRPGDTTAKVQELERKMTAEARAFLERFESPEGQEKMAAESRGRILKGLRRRPQRTPGESLDRYQRRVEQWETNRAAGRLLLEAGEK
ncbi:MAG: hypothetical protein N2039_10700, partial [Gemmataceae bacterium]|nr:hypothetical protein [Gemmataceae bacterium]